MHMYVYGTSQCVSIRRRIFTEIKSVHIADHCRPSVHYKHTIVFARILSANLAITKEGAISIDYIIITEIICIFDLNHVGYVTDAIEIKCWHWVKLIKYRLYLPFILPVFIANSGKYRKIRQCIYGKYRIIKSVFTCICTVYSG